MNLPQNILAFDTSTQTTSVALRTQGRELVHAEEGGPQASARLIALIDELLREAALGKHELDAIAFGCGPGAFTGLRTACAVAQGLGFALAKPLVAVTSLEALALQVHWQTGATHILAALDARMDELYIGQYIVVSGLPVSINGIELIRVSEVSSLLKDDASAWQGVGNAWATHGGAQAPWPANLRAPAQAATPDAHAMLAIATARLSRGEVLSAIAAEPVYVRNKVALTTAERDAAKLAKQAAASQTSARAGAS
jgi:tRNA threonylcarbamoyladenosine biosynthesis protein TsaB